MAIDARGDKFDVVREKVDFGPCTRDQVNRFKDSFQSYLADDVWATYTEYLICLQNPEQVEFQGYIGATL